MTHHTSPKTAGSRRVAVVTGEAGPPRAAGRRGTTRRRAVTARVELTAQEAQIARLAAEGLSNPEIGARPFCPRARSSTAWARSSPSST